MGLPWLYRSRVGPGKAYSDLGVALRYVISAPMAIATAPRRIYRTITMQTKHPYTKAGMPSIVPILQLERRKRYKILGRDLPSNQPPSIV